VKWETALRRIARRAACSGVSSRVARTRSATKQMKRAKNRVVASGLINFGLDIFYWLCVDKFVSKDLRCNLPVRASGHGSCTWTCSGGWLGWDNAWAGAGKGKKGLLGDGTPLGWVE
jgi:hypothetical protein